MPDTYDYTLIKAILKDKTITITDGNKITTGVFKDIHLHISDGLQLSNILILEDNKVIKTYPTCIINTVFQKSNMGYSQTKLEVILEGTSGITFNTYGKGEWRTINSITKEVIYSSTWTKIQSLTINYY